MRIISWDVGIVNLAYCILEEDNGKINIIDWDVIDLLDRGSDVHYCCGTTKAKPPQVCGKKATYKLPTLDGTYGFCKTHFSQHQQYLDIESIIDKTYTSNGPGNCSFLKRNGEICNKKSTMMEIATNNHYCTAHYKSCITKLKREYSLQLITKLNTNKIPTDKIKIALVNKMDSLLPRFVALGVSKVIIENQPAKKNGKMTAVANMLFDYFLIRGYIDKQDNLDIDLVRFFCADNKLKFNQHNTNKVLNKARQKQKTQQDKHVYKATKNLGVVYTKQLLADDPTQLEYLELHDKQDDLCDAFLQGRYYLVKFGNSC